MMRKLLISFLILIVMILLMRFQGASLITRVSPRGIIDLEFARTAERLMILRMFMNHSDVVLNIFLDFLFIASYTWFLMSACSFLKHKNVFPLWCNHFSGLALSAGFFDVLENFLMLLVWNGRFGPGLLQFIYFAAAIKFILIGMVILFLLVSIPFLFTKNKIKT